LEKFIELESVTLLRFFFGSTVFLPVRRTRLWKAGRQKNAWKEYKYGHWTSVIRNHIIAFTK